MQLLLRKINKRGEKKKYTVLHRPFRLAGKMSQQQMQTPVNKMNFHTIAVLSHRLIPVILILLSETTAP